MLHNGCAFAGTIVSPRRSVDGVAAYSGDAGGEGSHPCSHTHTHTHALHLLAPPSAFLGHFEKHS